MSVESVGLDPRARQMARSRVLGLLGSSGVAGGSLEGLRLQGAFLRASGWGVSVGLRRQGAFSRASGWGVSVGLRLQGAFSRASGWGGFDERHACGFFVMRRV